MVNHSRWCFNITKWNPTKEEWLKLTSSIAGEELERINKFVFQDDAKSSLIGCALIRKFISQATRVPSNEPALVRNRYGRPEVCEIYTATKKNWPKLINFNVSHSGSYCVLAGIWSEDKHPCNVKIGVDVTKIVSKKTPDELARFLTLMSRREFTKEEWKTVERAPNDRQKCINFTRLWCLKESFIKAIGLGLSFKLHRISFEFPEQYKYSLSIDLLKDNLLCDTTVLLDNKLANNWRFIETALDDEHMVAIGYNNETDLETSISYPALQNGSRFEELSIESIVDSLTPITSADESNWTLFCTRGRK